jgi:hypothetical protein
LLKNKIVNPICDLRGAVIWHQVVRGNGRQGTDALVWNARTDDGHLDAAGIYVLRMIAFNEKQKQTGIFEQKMTLLP